MSEERVSSLLETLRASVADEGVAGSGNLPLGDNIADLAAFRQQKEAAKQEEEDEVVAAKLAYDVSPKELLELAMRDVDKHNIKKAYLTMISDSGDCWSTHNYRSCLSRTEEIAYRQLGVEESLDRWRDGKPGD